MRTGVPGFPSLVRAVRSIQLYNVNSMTLEDFSIRTPQDELVIFPHHTHVRERIPVVAAKRF